MYDKVCQKRRRCAPPFLDNLEKTGGGGSQQPPASRAKVNYLVVLAKGKRCLKNSFTAMLLKVSLSTQVARLFGITTPPNGGSFRPFTTRKATGSSSTSEQESTDRQAAVMAIRRRWANDFRPSEASSGVTLSTRKVFFIQLIQERVTHLV